MLDELDIQDFVLADRLRVRFSPGLTAITGETGAGKSLIVDALGVLLGDRASPDLIRTGASVARIEGSFLVSEGDEDLLQLLAEVGIEPEEGMLIISREMSASGRSSARINGRAVVQSTLSAVGNRLVDIHSQTEHLAILRPAQHVDYLDRYAATLPDRRRIASGVAELRELRSELNELQHDARERVRRQERLAYEIQEIQAAQLDRGEEEALRNERRRLANAEQLTQLAGQAYLALEGDGEGPGASGPLSEAVALVGQLARLDEALSDDATALSALQSQISEIARTLRGYGEQVEYSPERLQQIEERLELLSTLKRKYGASIEEVMTYAAAASRELLELSGSEERIERLTEQERDLMERLASQAEELSQRRRAAAHRLCRAVEGELGDLGLAGGRFGVRLEPRPDLHGVAIYLTTATVTSEATGEEVSVEPALVAIDRTGVDRVEFVVSLNPGEPLRPLARVASGGETSRLMLALKTILGEADAVPTLVFDEVDVGVGGRSGGIVGQKLRRLSDHHQVICVTHLPQIASLAETHLAIEKRVDGEQTAVAARDLRGEDRLREVAAMLGSDTPATRASARELLRNTIC